MQLAAADLQRLCRIGWRSDTPAANALKQAESGRLVRIVEQHRSGYRFSDGVEEGAAQAPAAWIRADSPPEQRAAVGDWVLLDKAQSIQALLPRHSLLKRAAAGQHYRQQLIAANIDTVFVVMGLDGDFNPRRVARYLVLIQGSGAEPVLLLTKADTCADPENYRQPLAEFELKGITLHFLDAKNPHSSAVLAPYLGLGHTAVLVGSSGAGKSTLTNTLLGADIRQAQAVRAHDNRGRHTTTHRALIMLPSGGCLIDTPGMRELKLTGEETLSEAGFGDIEVLAASCRFRDCRHHSEPGCAVQAALKSGTLAADHYQQYRKLQEELAAASMGLAVRQARQEARIMGKALKKRLVDKYGYS